MSVDRVAPAIRTVGGYERISTSIVVFRGFLMVICITSFHYKDPS